MKWVYRSTLALGLFILSATGILANSGTAGDQNFAKAVEAYEQGDFQATLLIVRPLATNGHARSQNLLGLMYAKGQGVTQSSTEAVLWYRKSAVNGDFRGQFNLSLAYRKGEGVPHSPKESLTWLTKSADQGFAWAQHQLAIDYALGQHVAVNERTALKWMKLAAEQNYVPAQFGLGNMYLAGKGVQEDRREAIRWFNIAAQGGDTAAAAKIKELESSGPNNIEPQQKSSEFRQIFIEKYRVTQIITERNLTTNPFIYKDKVVGVKTKFNRMIAETEALFYFEVLGVPNPILVSDVPSTLFASKRHTLLVIRVMGTKAFKTGQGEVALPHGRFVAEYNCEPSDCDEVFK